MTLSAASHQIGPTSAMPDIAQQPAARTSGPPAHTDTLVQELSAVGVNDTQGTRPSREVGSGIPARRPARSVDVSPIEESPPSSGLSLKGIAEWLARIDMRSDVAVLGELLINGRDDKGPSRPPQGR
ncbi:hypothetical protein [Bordetella flabilis]|nr:hypothetical protein [Bordetella flabilis]